MSRPGNRSPFHHPGTRLLGHQPEGSARSRRAGREWISTIPPARGLQIHMDGRNHRFQRMGQFFDAELLNQISLRRQDSRHSTTGQPPPSMAERIPREDALTISALASNCCFPNRNIGLLFNFGTDAEGGKGQAATFPNGESQRRVTKSAADAVWDAISSISMS